MLNPEIIITEQKLKQDNWKIEEIIKVSHQMIEKFTEIEKQANSGDPELMNCLAILHFISCDYEKALYYFQNILKYDPNNFSIWNKIGATFALLKKTDKAQECYFKALDLKPNYVRGWANLAINFNINQDYPKASLFFLNSIALNPKARHLWSYLESTFISRGYSDGIKKINGFDVSKFSHEHNVHGFEELPKPEGMNYVDIFEKYNLNGCLNDWVQKFEKQ
jgi:tetratricopeptide (TPR) repeat protein